MIQNPIHLTVSAVDADEKEKKLLAVIKSDAGLKEKCDACRELAITGTAEAVDTLASLLDDEQLAHRARYGLEPLPDPAVDQAFRGALGKLKGLHLVGVIGSIGVRRDSAAVPQLIKLLTDSDSEVVKATARTLGSIGTLEAANALKQSLKTVSAKNKLAVCEGLFRCAEVLAAYGETSAAMDIYKLLNAADVPHQVKTGALHGMERLP